MKKIHNFDIESRVLESYFPKGTSFENPAVFSPDVCNTVHLMHCFDSKTKTNFMSNGQMKNNSLLRFSGINVVFSKDKNGEISSIIYQWYKDGVQYRAGDKPSTIYYDGTSIRFSWHDSISYSTHRKYKPAIVVYHDGILFDALWYHYGEELGVTQEWFITNGINVNKMSKEDKVLYDMKWAKYAKIS